MKRTTPAKDCPTREANDDSNGGIEKPSHNLSRRQFGRHALLATVASVAPSATLPSIAATAEPANSQVQTPEPLKGLTPQQIADVEAKLSNILRQWGSRFSVEQKARLRRVLAQNERLLAPVRAFSIQNGDAPASVLRISFDQPQSSASNGSED